MLAGGRRQNLHGNGSDQEQRRGNRIRRVLQGDREERHDTAESLEPEGGPRGEGGSASRIGQRLRLADLRRLLGARCIGDPALASVPLFVTWG